MALLNSYQYSTTTTTTTSFLIIVLLHHLLPCPVSSSNQLQPPAISPRELLYEEKNRLGSIPPSCHNKCNECHPCMAVQVPSLPSHNSVPPYDLTKKINAAASMGSSSWLNPSSQGNNRYSNYKPLGWKCHCGGHFFNP